MTGFLLDAIYLLGLLGSSPIWIYRMIRHGRYRSGWSQRFGAGPVRYGLQPIIWIHGVSLGEINAARTLVQEIHSQLPDFRIVISSTTDTGFGAAKKLFAQGHLVFHWPLDLTFSVRRALERVRPDLVVLIEGEVWPNFLAACNRRDIPVVVVNARLGADKGYPRYRKLGRLAGKLFNRLTAIGVQDEIYAQRFRSLGADDDRIHLTGMMKFDTARIAESIEGSDALAEALRILPDQQLVVAGGTGPGEEKMILEFWGELKRRHPRGRLVIVPRKPERFGEVGKLISSMGFKVLRRSDRPDGSTSAVPRAPETVILGDTMGELRKFYSLAACIFVGRSLVAMGGSDMIEAAALNKATAFGLHTFNFPQAEKLAEHGCVRVEDAEALMQQFDEWLLSPKEADRAGKEAQQYIRSQKGATIRNVEMICKVLGRVPAAAPGAIATDAITGLQHTETEQKN